MCLPKLVNITNIEDYGEYGAANCPHCGAKGRYIHVARTTTGETVKAMAGCIKLYPTHKLFFKETQRIQKKELEYKEKGWNLPALDQAVLDIIDRFLSKELTEKQATSMVNLKIKMRNNRINKKYR